MRSRPRVTCAPCGARGGLHARVGEARGVAGGLAEGVEGGGGGGERGLHRRDGDVAAGGRRLGGLLDGVGDGALQARPGAPRRASRARPGRRRRPRRGCASSSSHWFIGAFSAALVRSASSCCTSWRAGGGARGAGRLAEGGLGEAAAAGRAVRSALSSESLERRAADSTAVLFSSDICSARLTMVVASSLLGRAGNCAPQQLTF